MVICFRESTDPGRVSGSVAAEHQGTHDAQGRIVLGCEHQAQRRSDQQQGEPGKRADQHQLGLALMRSGYRSLAFLIGLCRHGGLTHAARTLERAFHGAQNRFLDELAVDHDKTRGGFLEGSNDTPGMVQLGLGGREDLMQRGDLLGVDRTLADETQTPRVPRLLCHALHVLEIKPGHVDGIETGTGGSGATRLRA